MGFSAPWVSFLGLGLAFLKGLFLWPLVGMGQRRGAEPGQEIEWWVKATFLMPLPFFHLFFPQDFMIIKLGAERFRFAEQHLQ